MAKIKAGARRADVARADAVEAGTIVEVIAQPDGRSATVDRGTERVRVRAGAGLSPVGAGGHAGAVDARLARLTGYRPVVGDRVLVARAGDEVFVIAVLAAAEAPALRVADGASAAIDGDALELRDAGGRLLVRYEGGVTTVSAPERDLHLSAPHGRVVLEAATDVTVRAARDLTQEAGRRIDLAVGVGREANRQDGEAPGAETAPALRVEASGIHVASPRVDVATRGARLAAGQVSVFARSIATTAEHLAQNVDRYDLTADTIVEKARDAFKDVSDLLQQRVGRAKTLVRGTFSLTTRRTTLVSRDETSVDGKKILLG